MCVNYIALILLSPESTALCPHPSALCPQPPALCPHPPALCPHPPALCPAAPYFATTLSLPSFHITFPSFYCTFFSHFTALFPNPSALSRAIYCHNTFSLIHMHFALILPHFASPRAHLLVVGMLQFMYRACPLLFIFSSCVCFGLYGPFNCISWHKFSQQLFALSLCSSSLISALLILSTICFCMKVSLSPDITLCGRLGLKYQPTN